MQLKIWFKDEFQLRGRLAFWAQVFEFIHHLPYTTNEEHKSQTTPSAKEWCLQADWSNNLKLMFSNSIIPIPDSLGSSGSRVDMVF